jgi:hypothetical protein
MRGVLDSMDVNVLHWEHIVSVSHNASRKGDLR